MALATRTAEARRSGPRSGRRDAPRFDRRDVWSMGVWAVVIAAATWWGHSLGAARLNVTWPPLHALFEPQAVTWRIMVPVGVAVMVTATVRLQRRIGWRALLACAVVAAFAWVLALNMWIGGGWDRFAAPIGSYEDYQGDIGRFDGPLDTLANYEADIGELNTHDRGHPPGPLVVVQVLHGWGLTDLRWVAALIVAVGSTAVAAVASVVRDLAGEDRARRLLPVLVLAPYALWIGVSWDAVFMAAAAWTALAWLRARERHTAFAAGLCGGLLLMLSYGLAPFGLVLLALRRDRRALAWGGLGVVAMLAVVWGLGFAYWDGLRATKDVVDGVYATQGGRPYWYWWLGDLAALGWAVGPALGLSAGRALRRPSRIGPLELLVLAAAAAVVAMILGGVTKAEVERIWLPYMPWLLLLADRRPSGAVPGLQSAWGLGLSRWLLPWW